MCNFRAINVSEGRRGTKAVGRQKGVKVMNLTFMRQEIVSIILKAQSEGCDREELKRFYCEMGEFPAKDFDQLWPLRE